MRFKPYHILLLCLFGCSENNFLPTRFDDSSSTDNDATVFVEQGSLDSKQKHIMIYPNEIHRFTADIEPGYAYIIEYNITISASIETRLAKDGVEDTLYFGRANLYPTGASERPLFAALKTAKLHLNLQNSVRHQTQAYTIALKREPLTALNNSYLDTAMVPFHNRPVRSTFTDSLNTDTITYDHINRKFLYKISLDSFEMVSVTIREDRSGGFP